MTGLKKDQNVLAKNVEGLRKAIEDSIVNVKVTQNKSHLTVYSLSFTTFKCHNEVLSAFPYTFLLEHYNISKATKCFNMDNLKKSVKQTHYFLKVIKHSNLRSNEKSPTGRLTT